MWWDSWDMMGSHHDQLASTKFVQKRRTLPKMVFFGGSCALHANPGLVVFIFIKGSLWKIMQKENLCVLGSKHVIPGYLPLWKIWVSQLGLLFPIYGTIKFMFQTTNQCYRDVHGLWSLVDEWSSPSRQGPLLHLPWQPRHAVPAPATRSRTVLASIWTLVLGMCRHLRIQPTYPRWLKFNTQWTCLPSNLWPKNNCTKT